MKEKTVKAEACWPKKDHRNEKGKSRIAALPVMS